MILPLKIIVQDELYVTNQPMEIMTILGSCIAVCMWDDENCVAGMNHYLMPLCGKGSQSLKYGNISIKKLLDEMLLQAASQQNIVAKIFGGAAINIKSSATSVGNQNIQIAETVLSDLNIPIIARDVGGTKGRKIIFSTIDGSVFVKTSVN